MKSYLVDRIRDRSSSISFQLTILSLVLSSTVALSETKQKSSATPSPTIAPKPFATPNPSPTPETKIDPKMEAELLQAEDRFINAIRNRDAKALGDLLADYYADSFRDDERATNKRGFIQRASEGKLLIYRIEKERKLTRSGVTFTVDGQAKKAGALSSEENPKDEWISVRRIWLRQGDRWLAIAQIVQPLEEEADREKSEAAEKKR